MAFFRDCFIILIEGNYHNFCKTGNGGATLTCGQARSNRYIILMFYTRPSIARLRLADFLLL